MGTAVVCNILRSARLKLEESQKSLSLEGHSQLAWHQTLLLKPCCSLQGWSKVSESVPLVSSEQVWDPTVPACELWSPHLPRASWQLYCHKLIKLSILTENAPKHTDMRALLWPLFVTPYRYPSTCSNFAFSLLPLRTEAKTPSKPHDGNTDPRRNI